MIAAERLVTPDGRDSLSIWKEDDVLHASAPVIVRDHVQGGVLHANNNNNNNQAHFYGAMTSPQTILGRFTKRLDLDDEKRR